jgi:hypothetical protein
MYSHDTNVNDMGYRLYFAGQSKAIPQKIHNSPHFPIRLVRRKYEEMLAKKDRPLRSLDKVNALVMTAALVLIVAGAVPVRGEENMGICGRVSPSGIVSAQDEEACDKKQETQRKGFADRVKKVEVTDAIGEGQWIEDRIVIEEYRRIDQETHE